MDWPSAVVYIFLVLMIGLVAIVGIMAMSGGFKDDDQDDPSELLPRRGIDWNEEDRS